VEENPALTPGDLGDLLGYRVVIVGTQLMGQPAFYLIFALILVFVFAMVTAYRRASLLESDLLGVRGHSRTDGRARFEGPMVGLIAGTALLVAINVGSDMQQDRSTGYRLGTNRTYQFRIRSPALSWAPSRESALPSCFMTAYPILQQDQTVMSAAQQPAAWSSAMTYKFVGALRSLTDDKLISERPSWWAWLSVLPLNWRAN